MVACKRICQNMRAYQTFTKNSYSHIDAELLLVSIMKYTIRIPLCPLVFIVNINNSATAPAYLNGRGGHYETLALNLLEDVLSTYLLFHL